MIILVKCISLKNNMLGVIKKNQIIIFAIAFMLITAGYLNYSMNVEQTAEASANTEIEEYAGIGDARLVSNDNVIQDVINYNTNNTVETASKNNQEQDSYFSESRLQSEKMYSEMLESYQSILANPNTSAEQKNVAQTEISNICKKKNAIMIAENLIKNKGFKDIVIFVNNESVSCVVRAEKIEEAEIAQIQSIIQRELNVSAQNIHISCK